ncbi:hypothetical protein [uncultured Sutterella sp.]|nr:hypothetical protein [uncultured Sutterella sp.]
MQKKQAGGGEVSGIPKKEGEMRLNGHSGGSAALSLCIIYL